MLNDSAVSPGPEMPSNTSGVGAEQLIQPPVLGGASLSRDHLLYDHRLMDTELCVKPRTRVINCQWVCGRAGKTG